MSCSASDRSAPVVAEICVKMASPLQQQHVLPSPIEAAKPLATADYSESNALMETEAGLVLGEYAGLYGPDTAGLRRLDQVLHQRIAHTLPTCLLGHVDAVLNDTFIDAPARDGAGGHPATHFSFGHGDKSVRREVRRIPALPGRDIGLERGVGRADPFRVYACCLGPMLGAQLSYKW